MSPKVDVVYSTDFVYEELRGKNVMSEMVKIQNIMFSLGMNWWFSAGTVLGLVREPQGYILHDKDIDLEIQIRSGLEFTRLKFIMDLIGYKLIREVHVNNHLCQLAFISDEDIIIDFYAYYLEEDYKNYNELGVLSIPKDMITNKSLFQFKEFKFVTPSPVEDYLKYRYGDWKTPRHSKVSWGNDVGEALSKW